MDPLQLYCPPNKQSKAYLVLDAARKGWDQTIDIHNYARGDGPAMFWGFVGENFNSVKFGHTTVKMRAWFI